MSEAPLAMIIEDDPDASEIAGGMLQMLGFRIKICPDAHQALYALAEQAPDLILLDICLPEMDGVNLLKVARRVAEARDVPVIAASAVYPKGGPIERSLRELGVKVFMSKPFTLQSLKSALDQAMPRHRIAKKAPIPVSMTGRIDGEAKVAGKPVQISVTGGDSTSLKVKTTATPLPAGSLTVTLTRREVVDDQIRNTEILLLASASGTESAEGGWTSILSVTAARPQDAYDRMVAALEGQ
jgi:two-component system, cell cycle response regulator DivK